MKTRYARVPHPSIVLAVSVAFAAILVGCGSKGSRANSAVFADEVRAASAAWDEAFNSGNLSRLMVLYNNEAVSMPFERPALEGKAAVEEDFRAFFEEFDAHHQTTIVGLQIAGDWAIERGQYTMQATARDGSESFEEAGKHIVVRQKTDDAWKVVWEIWNLDAPTE